MSQYDFGVIDPQVRDGSWLADALNQWRDSRNSMHGGNAAPPYVVDGMLWRDTSGAPAMVRYKVRQAGADRELWNISNAGTISFPAVTIDWNNVPFAWFKGTPTSFRTDGSVGIGAAPVGSSNLYVYNAGAHAWIEAVTGNAASVAMVRLRNTTNAYDIRTSGSQFLVWDAIASVGRITLDANGLVGIGGTPGNALEVFRGDVGDVWITAFSTAGARNAGFIFRNVAHQWAVYTTATDGHLYFHDFTRAALPMVISNTGKVTIGAGYASTEMLDIHGPSGATARVRVYVPSASQAMFQVQNSLRQWGMICMETGEWWLYDYIASRKCIGVNTSGDVSVLRLRGGPGDSGNLRSHTTANYVNFRWDGTNLLYRIDETLERTISSFSAASNVTYLYMNAGGPGAYGFHLRVLGGGYDGYFAPDQSSDMAQKYNVKPASVDALAVICSVDLIEYDFIPANGQRVPLGFNANILQQQIPEMVFQPEGQYLHLNAKAGVPYLFRAVQQLEERMMKLEEKESWQSSR